METHLLTTFTLTMSSLAAFVYLIWTDTLQSAWLMSQMSVEWWIYILHDGHCNCSARNLTELISFSQSLLGKWLSSLTVQESCKSSSACFLFKGCKVIDQSSMFSCKQANGPAILPIPHTDYQSKHSINSQCLFPWYLRIKITKLWSIIQLVQLTELVWFLSNFSFSLK